MPAPIVVGGARDTLFKIAKVVVPIALLAVIAKIAGPVLALVALGITVATVLLYKAYMGGYLSKIRIGRPAWLPLPTTRRGWLVVVAAILAIAVVAAALIFGLPSLLPKGGEKQTEEKVLPQAETTQEKPEGGFWSNLFGGDKGQTAAATKKPTTAGGFEKGEVTLINISETQTVEVAGKPAIGFGFEYSGSPNKIMATFEANGSAEFDGKNIKFNLTQDNPAMNLSATNLTKLELNVAGNGCIFPGSPTTETMQLCKDLIDKLK